MVEGGLLPNPQVTAQPEECVLESATFAARRPDERLIEPTEGASTVALLLAGAVSTASPVLTAVVVAIVYRRLPHLHVGGGGAAFGAMVARVLVEAGKQLFFCFTRLATRERGRRADRLRRRPDDVGASRRLIFLYGAAVTRIAGELRPGVLPRTGDLPRDPRALDAHVMGRFIVPFAPASLGRC